MYQTELAKELLDTFDPLTVQKSLYIASWIYRWMAGNDPDNFIQWCNKSQQFDNILMAVNAEVKRRCYNG